MRSMNKVGILTYLVGAFLTCNLHARTCAGNGEVVGAYGFLGTRTVFTPTPVNPPGTTGAVTVSSTPMGSLIAGASSAGGFGAVGTIQADGAGNLFATAGGASTTVLQVGTYTVNGDCSITLTLTDPFLSSGSGTSASFEGLVVENGNEIDLTQAIGGVVVTLQKTAQFSACSADNLSGNYGFTAAGSTVTATSLTPFSLLGRLVADGAGNFAVDSAASNSPLPKRQYTGAYSVNPDCTGTGTLISSDKVSRSISFVLVNELSTGNTGSPRQAIIFVLTNTGISGTGWAKQQ